MLDDASLITAWENGYGRPPYQQALVLLSLASPNETVDELMKLSLGIRDAKLLALRRKLFGSRIESLANCPECNETIELDFSVADISVQHDQCSNLGEIEIDGYRIQFRVPTSRDLTILSRISPANRAEQLLCQCVRKAERDSSPINPAEFPSSVRDQLSLAIAEHDPQADIQLQLSCPECDHRWSSPFDIVAFLWAELSTWCQRLMAEIHLLATAYGWTESQILSLSRWRRQLYVGMVRQ